jgi:hypothetical protein
MGITLYDLNAQRAMLKRGEEKRKAARQAKERERLRDTFAAAALTGLLANGDYNPSTPVLAFRMADAMLRERARNGSVEGCETVQSDHIPDAGKMVETPGEIDKYRRFIGEVMNWISEATGFLHDDVLRTDDARDTITNACSQCWDAFDRIAYPTTNHDAAPAARASESPCAGHAGTGGTPVTKPMPVFVSGSGSVTPVAYQENDEKRVFYDTTGGESDRPQPIGSPAETNPTQPRNGTPAEGSVPGECSVLDSRNWKEPVAWAVVYPNDEVAIVAFKRRDADERASASDRVVPLYRSPTLTDEEREAMRESYMMLQLAGSPHAAAIWGLLKRIG